MHAKKTAAASATPTSDFLPRCERCHQAHSPAAGRNDNNVVLSKAATPQSNPNSSQGSQPSRSSSVSASQKSVVSNSADRLVSHTQRVHQNMTFGNRAQAQVEPTATFSEKIRRAIRKIGMHVRAEKTLLRANSTKAEAFE